MNNYNCPKCGRKLDAFNDCKFCKKELKQCPHNKDVECGEFKCDSDCEVYALARAKVAINKLCVKYDEGIECSEAGMRVLYKLAKEAQQYLQSVQ